MEVLFYISEAWVRTCIGYASGRRNLHTEPYPYLLSCFAVVGATKMY